MSGGKREGAGRPKGTGTGRKVISKSISMPKEAWEKLDVYKTGSRGKFIAKWIATI